MVIGLYHSLLLETVFLNKEELKNIRSYFQTKSFANTDIKNTIEYLYKHNFIINSENEDNALHEKAIELLPSPAISNVYVVVTENCNFNCKYCFLSEAVNSDKRTKIMTAETTKATVALLQKTYESEKTNYERVITFYGGEPLLNFDIIKYFINEVEEIKKTKQWPKDVRYAVITNGSLLSLEIIEFLKLYNFTLGISFDGDKLSHSNRISKDNNDTFDIVREKIDLCKRNEMPFTLSITITENLINNRGKIIQKILTIKPHDVAFNLLIPSNAQKQNNSYYENATDFMIEAFKVFRENGLYEDRVMRKVRAFIGSRIYPYDCCASGGNQYVISPKGEIGICHAYLNNNKYFSSSVFDENFDHTANENFKYWKNRTPLLMEKCFDCKCLGICGGGCPYAAEYMNGSIYDLDERFCIHAKRLLEWLIKDLYNSITVN